MPSQTTWVFHTAGCPDLNHCGRIPPQTVQELPEALIQLCEYRCSRDYPLSPQGLTHLRANHPPEEDVRRAFTGGGSSCLMFPNFNVILTPTELFHVLDSITLRCVITGNKSLNGILDVEFQGSLDWWLSCVKWSRGHIIIKKKINFWIKTSPFLIFLCYNAAATGLFLRTCHSAAWHFFTDCVSLFSRQNWII